MYQQKRIRLLFSFWLYYCRVDKILFECFYFIFHFRPYQWFMISIFSITLVIVFIMYLWGQKKNKQTFTILFFLPFPPISNIMKHTFIVNNLHMYSPSVGSGWSWYKKHLLSCYKNSVIKEYIGSSQWHKIQIQICFIKIYILFSYLWKRHNLWKTEFALWKK